MSAGAGKASPSAQVTAAAAMQVTAAAAMESVIAAAAVARYFWSVDAAQSAIREDHAMTRFNRAGSLLAWLAVAIAGCGTESPRPESDAGRPPTVDASAVDAAFPDGTAVTSYDATSGAAMSGVGESSED